MDQKVGIVAFAFGVPSTLMSNRRIAEIASRRAWADYAPVYTQYDVRIEDQKPGYEVKIEYTPEVPGLPPPTLRMARGAVQWAKEQGFTRLQVVAAKPHLWRAMRDLGQAVHEAGVSIDIQACDLDIDKYQEEDWFCYDSWQERTKSRALWEKRERVLRWMPYFIYKHVAS